MSDCCWIGDPCPEHNPKDASVVSRWDHATWLQQRLGEARQQAAKYEAALVQIASTARWYADNSERLPIEVDHALCVEVLDVAERALDD